MSWLNIWLLLNLSFVQRALIVGFIISITTALLGSTLIYRRLALIGDSLAHIGFGAISLTIALSWSPLMFSVPTMIVASIIIALVSENKRIYSDALLGIISSSALAFGVIIAAKSKGFSIDVATYLFGSILTLTAVDVSISLILGSIVISVVLLLHNRIFLITHDEEYAKTRGINIRLYKVILATLTGITVSIGMRLTGSLLISSLIIFPVSIANRLTNSYKMLVLVASLTAIVTFYIGIIASIIFEIPSGATIIIINLFFLGVSNLIKR